MILCDSISDLSKGRLMTLDPYFCTNMDSCPYMSFLVKMIKKYVWAKLDT